MIAKHFSSFMNAWLCLTTVGFQSLRINWTLFGSPTPGMWTWLRNISLYSCLTLFDNSRLSIPQDPVDIVWQLQPVEEVHFLPVGSSVKCFPLSLMLSSYTLLADAILMITGRCLTMWNSGSGPSEPNIWYVNLISLLSLQNADFVCSSVGNPIRLCLYHLFLIYK